MSVVTMNRTRRGALAQGRHEKNSRATALVLGEFFCWFWLMVGRKYLQSVRKKSLGCAAARSVPDAHRRL